MRRHSRIVVCSAMLALSGIGVASAADLPPGAPPTVFIPPPQIFSWTGFYVGANAGWGWANTTGSFTSTAGTGTFSASGNGFVGGGQAGYNWQTGPLVLGVEADFQGTSANGTFSTPTGPAISGTAKTPWFGTARARVGYAVDRLMVYATAGGVYGDTSLNGAGPATGSFSSSTTFWSWTAGAGLEYAFYGCWSAKLEYLYVGAPSKFPAMPTVTSASQDNSSNTSIVRLGLNYHF
jgi:outer membrane immunogenic protein